MLEVLLPARHCQWCGGDLEDRKRTARFCSDTCRGKAFLRRHPDRRPRRGGEPLHNGKGRRRRRPGRRPPTRYLVFREEGECLVKVGEVATDRPDRAKTKAAQSSGIPVEQLRTVPAHNLR